MASLRCKECDQELQGEDQDHLEDSLRAHYLGKNDGAHEYPGKQQFREMYGFTEEETSEQPQGSEEDSTIETDEQSPETDKTEQSGDSEDLLGVDEMEETDLDDLIDETEEEIDSSEESTQSKGLDTAVNQAWGRIFTIDLDPEEEETAEETDPFEWVTEDDLTEPPVGRRLKQLDDRSLTALAIVLYAPWHHTDDDPSYRDLGTVFPYSRDWVGERVRAWRDGEFRDLVADPRPWGGR